MALANIDRVDEKRRLELPTAHVAALGCRRSALTRKTGRDR